MTFNKYRDRLIGYLKTNDILLLKMSLRWRKVKRVLVTPYNFFSRV